MRSRGTMVAATGRELINLGVCEMHDGVVYFGGNARPWWRVVEYRPTHTVKGVPVQLVDGVVYRNGTAWLRLEDGVLVGKCGHTNLRLRAI